MAEQKKQKTDRLTHEQWLARSLEILSLGGPGELRIDNITRKMNLTKGSFYWHFKNRADYIKSLAKYWDQWANDTVIKQVNAMEDDPKTKIKAIIETVIDGNFGAYDSAVQMLVHKEPQVAPIITKGFVKRIKFLNSLFKQLGFKGKELESRTRLFVGYFVLDAVLIDQESKTKRLQKALNMLEFITAK